MKITDAFNALNVIALTPATCAWLQQNDPQALKQVRDAICPAHIPDPVTTAARLLVERLENIGTSFAKSACPVVQADVCNGHAHVSVAFPNQEDAQVFCSFAKRFLHESAMVMTRGTGRASVEFLLDEGNI